MIDTKQYIESGILEDYLSGNLTPTERTEVESTADKYPEIAQELASMSLSLSVMADIGEVVPAAYMEDRIWNEILITNIEEETESETTEVPKTSKVPYIMTVAMAIIAFITIYYMIIANNRLDDAKTKITELEQANSELTQEFDKLKYNYDSLSTLSSIYDIENTKIYVMKPNRRSALSSVVILVWDKTTNQIYVDIKSLPESKSGMKYNLWATTQIGQQINLGSFAHDGASQVIELDKLHNAVKFLLTQEKESGVSHPTMSRVYSTANIY
jgi:cell division protein FtsL